MRRYKVIEVIKQLEKDGWHFAYKKGKVTVNGKLSDNLSQEILNTIWKQAEWR